MPGATRAAGLRDLHDGLPDVRREALEEHVRGHVQRCTSNARSGPLTA